MKPIKGRYRFLHSANWKELIQIVGVAITVCTTIIIGLNWFLDVRVKVNLIPTLTSTVRKNGQAIDVLSLKLQNFEYQLKLQENIKRQQEEIRKLQEELKSLKTLYIPNEKKER